MKNARLSALLALVLAPAAFAQENAQEENTRKEPPITLARVRSAFTQADADKGGSVSLREALAAGHTEREFKVLDVDGDGKITSDEFVLGYRSLQAGKGQKVASDLENEANRLEAQRRAEENGRERGANREDVEEKGPAAERLRRKNAQEGSAANEESPPQVDPARVQNRFGERASAGEANAGEPQESTGVDPRRLRDQQAEGQVSGVDPRRLRNQQAEENAPGVDPRRLRNQQIEEKVSGVDPRRLQNQVDGEGASNRGPAGARQRAREALSGLNRGASPPVEGGGPSPLRIRKRLSEENTRSLSSERLRRSLLERRKRAEEAQRRQVTPRVTPEARPVRRVNPTRGATRGSSRLQSARPRPTSRSRPRN